MPHDQLVAGWFSPASWLWGSHPEITRLRVKYRESVRGTKCSHLFFDCSDSAPFWIHCNGGCFVEWTVFSYGKCKTVSVLCCFFFAPRFVSWADVLFFSFFFSLRVFLARWGGRFHWFRHLYSSIYLLASPYTLSRSVFVLLIRSFPFFSFLFSLFFSHARVEVETSLSLRLFLFFFAAACSEFWINCTSFCSAHHSETNQHL